MNHCENKYVIKIFKSSFHINRLHYSVIAYYDIWFIISKGGLESFFIVQNIIFKILFRKLADFLCIKTLISVFYFLSLKSIDIQAFFTIKNFNCSYIFSYIDLSNICIVNSVNISDGCQK